MADPDLEAGPRHDAEGDPASDLAWDLRIGDVFPALRFLDRDPIPSAAVGVRAYNALRRIRCETWAELADATVGELWKAPNVGRKSVDAILTAAARRAAEEGGTELAIGRDPRREEHERALVKNSQAASIGLRRLERIIQTLATWGVRERAASTIADLLEPSPNLGRIPPEIRDEVAELGAIPIAALMEGLEVELPADLPSAYLESIDRADILITRRITLADRPTLEELGVRFGVTRERVRQLEVRAAASAQEGAHTARFSPLRWRASDLREVLGSAAVEESEFVRDALSWACRGLEDPEGIGVSEILLWLAGPYRREGRWLVLSESSLETLQKELSNHFADVHIVSRAATAQVLDELVVNPSVTDEFMRDMPGWRAISGDTFVRWSGAVGDKAEVVLLLLGRPCSVEELNEHIGEGHAITSVRNALSPDPRFVRMDKAGTYGLSEWGLEEYSGIAQEIIERIERNGGSVDLEEVVIDLVDQFGVSASSVRTYATAPAFSVSAGRVSLRCDDDPYAPDDRIHRVRGLYVPADGCVILHLVVDRDILRGSGRQLPEAAAVALGVVPGTRADFAFAESRIVVTWPTTSFTGPSLGSTRAAAASLGLVDGDEMRLVFDKNAMSCRAERVHEHDLQALTGLEVVEGCELEQLADALRVDERFVRARLQARGDDAVLACLPALEADDRLAVAISDFGDLLT